MRFGDIINMRLLDSDAKLRNDIIHNGVYPKKQQVIDFGNSILQFFYKVIDKIKSEIAYDVYMGYVYSVKNDKIDTYKQTFKDKEVQIQTVSDAIDFFTRNIDGIENFEKLCSIIEQNNRMLAAHSIDLEASNRTRRQ